MIAQVSAFSYDPMTLSEGQGHSNWSKKQEKKSSSCLYHHTTFERNWFLTIRTQANLKHFLHIITNIEFFPLKIYRKQTKKYNNKKA